MIIKYLDLKAVYENILKEENELNTLILVQRGTAIKLRTYTAETMTLYVR